MIAALASSVMVIRAWRACSLQAWSFCAFGRSGNQLVMRWHLTCLCGRDCKQACAALRWLDYAPGMECKGFRLESWTYEGARLELPEAEPLGCGASGACTKAALPDRFVRSFSPDRSSKCYLK